MKAERFEISDDFVIVGTALRTSPRTDATDIPPFWQRFLAEGIPRRLPRRSDDASVYAVYCDYESDFNGPYTMVLGVAVAANAEVPAGMRRVRVPKGRYARFVAEGDPSRVIWQTWGHINGEWELRSERRYIADFERYPADAAPGGPTRAEVVVGLA